MTETVVLCDLRHCPQAQAAYQEVGRLLADPDTPDLRLLLVLDTPSTVTEHALAYEELWRSRRVEQLLDVVVGPLAPAGRLEIPGSIGTDRDAGVIWVGDATGVDWRVTASTIAHSHSGEAGQDGLKSLISTLCEPQVFRRVLGLIAGIPERVVSPGLRIYEATADQTMFLAALSRCIGCMLSADGAIRDSDLALAGDPSRDAGDPSRMSIAARPAVVPGSRLAVARDRCTSGATELAELADALGTATALLGADHLGTRARALAIRAGTELREYRTAVQVLIATPAGERARRLRDWGIHSVVGRSTEPDDIASTITAAVQNGTPLPALSLRLRDYERELRARGDAAASGLVEQACPPALENRFTEPEPMAGPQPWLIAIGAAAVGLAALGHGFGIAAGLVTALAWLGLLGLTVARAPGGRLTEHRGSLVAGAIAATTGLVVGIAVAEALRPPPVIGVAGVIIGLCAALASVTWSWRVRARRWRQALRTEDVLQAASGLTDVVIAAASRAQSDESKRQDALIRARSAIEGVGAALLAYQQKLDDDLLRSPARRRIRREFEAFVARGLALLVLEALKPILSTLTSSSPHEHEQWARTRAADLLRRWDQHADGHSPLEPPEFITGEHMRTDALGDDDLTSITETITTEPHDVMWQLCQAADIGLLDPLASQMAVLRFAPRAVLSHADGAFPVSAEWISSTTRAGILRLVPIRSGVVHRIWSTTGEPADEPVIHNPRARGNPGDGRART